MQARPVWVIHKGLYPSDQTSGGGAEDRSQLLLVFFQRCITNPIVRNGSIKTILIDQLANLLYIWQLMISVQFIDHARHRTRDARAPGRWILAAPLLPRGHVAAADAHVVAAHKDRPVPARGEEAPQVVVVLVVVVVGWMGVDGVGVGTCRK